MLSHIQLTKDRQLAAEAVKKQMQRLLVNGKMEGCYKLRGYRH